MTVNTSNSASVPTTSNRLGDQEIYTILEETTAEKTSNVASRTLQQQLRLVLQNQAQLSTELKQLSLKLGLILQNQDQLSKEVKQSILSSCPPPPPPPPALKYQKNSTTTAPTSEATQLTRSLPRSQSMPVKEPTLTQKQIMERLANLRSFKKGNETTPSLQATTAPTSEATQLTRSLPRNQSMPVKEPTPTQKQIMERLANLPSFKKGNETTPSLQATTAPTSEATQLTRSLPRNQSMPVKEPTPTQKQIMERLANLPSFKKGNETTPSLQATTAPTSEATQLTRSLPRNQSMPVKEPTPTQKQIMKRLANLPSFKKGNETTPSLQITTTPTSETKENISVANRIKQFS